MPSKNIAQLVLVLLLYSCTSKTSQNSEKVGFDRIAKEYVKLGLTIGRYDGDFVDAYYGPDSLKPTTKAGTVFPKDSFLMKIKELKSALADLAGKTANDTIKDRAGWMTSQLTAFERRVLIFSGESAPFDTESKELFDAVAPVYSESHFQSLIARLDSILPGQGPLPDRFQKMASRFLIPKNKIDTLFKTAIAEARKRTLEHYKMPAQENFQLEYVTDKPWSGYNWYKGNYKSLIQINISQPIFIERAIDLACHEGYPGHHVYNALLEKNLYHDKGWTEISLYPLFSPQSLIAEGSANFGISLAFPGDEQKQFCKNVLMPLAGLDTTGTNAYFEALEIRSELNYARNEVARGLLSNKMSGPEAIRWLTDYCLLTEKGATIYFNFIKKYRSYVINYNYGQDLIKNYIRSKGGTEANPALRWKLFEELLSNQVKASDLLVKTE
ncbi:hypothetical protein [Dyadobacter pollutisoli]|uniref:DUF885 domain-containing protein n=1 Tax=Dyadobacter pollutisoli TaxID=2910158 RepID=A0A9E8SJ71_9BACT|nr:hypothetical protein [Dyadobacter pollutisoli]WAC09884.1 hypothetical protein ON006_19245 [Dyadobacter pollutisoli]